jgi:peptidoglycan/LPS O-acetylase OafA/YrhL
LRVVSAAAFVGVFSYSLYLTHELVIMQSWWFVLEGFPPIMNTLLIVVPATIAFAWLFFRFCEKPYMRKGSMTEGEPRAEDRRVDQTRTEEVSPVFSSSLPAVADEA